MNQDLKHRLHSYFSAIENPTAEEKLMKEELEGRLSFFKITSVHRDDLFEAGYNGALADDSQMDTIAGKLSNDYCEQLFWVALPIIAEYAGVPELRTKECPECNSKLMAYSKDNKEFRCTECNHTWPLIEKICANCAKCSYMISDGKITCDLDGHEIKNEMVETCENIEIISD